MKRVAFGVVVGAILPLGACRQIVGIEDSPQTNVVTTAGGIEFGTGACAACAQTHCFGPATVCSETHPCKPYEDCLGTCKGDPACRAQCTADNPIAPGSASEITTLSVCMASNCESDCGLSCGGIADYVTQPSNAVSCEKCLGNDCDTERTCATSTDCDAYVRCVLSCPTADCKEACGSTIDGGQMTFATFDAARKSQCARECAYGNDWSCVGHFSPPQPKPMSTTTMTFARIYDHGTAATSMTPIPSPKVTICGPVGSFTDFSCSSPLKSALGTDNNGDVTISMVPIGLSFNGDGLNGFARIQADGFMDSWFFWGFPLSKPSVTWGPPNAFLDRLPSSAAAGSGDVWVVAFDCLALQAGGVHIHINSATGAEPDYFMYDNDAGTFANVPGSTGPPGIAKYSGLPVGVYKFFAFPEGDTQPSSVVTANVFDGAETLVTLFPNQ